MPTIADYLKNAALNGLVLAVLGVFLNYLDGEKWGSILAVIGIACSYFSDLFYVKAYNDYMSSGIDRISESPWNDASRLLSGCSVGAVAVSLLVWLFS